MQFYCLFVTGDQISKQAGSSFNRLLSLSLLCFMDYFYC